MRWFIVVFLHCALGWSQQPAQRPKIGIALEGGSALGLAHIGVLEWLEENRVPVDYIAGTSMGGLVGGLYASGMSPQQLRDFVTQIDWQGSLSGSIHYPDLAFRRKEDRIAFPNRLELGYRKGLSLPGGLNQGHQVGLLLDRATLPYSALKSFDELPTPFRCTAVDLAKGDLAVFEDGSLSTALRSTMSIPGVFAPSSRDGGLYSDGGALNNLPVDIARKMGADIVIAVYLKKPDSSKTVNSVLGVLNRNVDIIISANEKRNIESADILLTADTGDFASTDYHRALDIAARGRQSAEAKAALLRRLALPESDWASHMSRRRSRIKSHDVAPTFIEFSSGVPDGFRRTIQRSLAPYLGKPIDSEGIERILNRLTGLGRFATAGYDLIERDGKVGLEIRASEKLHGPPFVNMGFEIDGVQPDDVRFAFAARLTLLDLGGFRSEWRHDIAFGARYGYRTEYYRPFKAASNWFFAPRLYAAREPFSFYSGNREFSRYRLVQLGAGADIGYNFNRFTEIRAGHEIRWLKADLIIGAPLLTQFRGSANVSRIGFRYEGADDAVVPRRGAIVRSNLEYYSRVSQGINAYPVFESAITYFQPVSRRSSVFGGIAGGTNFGAADVLFAPFLLGGPLSYGAYGRNELYGDDYFTLTAGYLREIAFLPPFAGDRIFAGALYQTGKVYGSTDQNPHSFTPLLIVKTVAGPVFFGAGVGDRSHRRWFFGMGRIF